MKENRISFTFLFVVHLDIEIGVSVRGRRLFLVIFEKVYKRVRVGIVQKSGDLFH